MMTIEKTVSNEIRKWSKFKCDVLVIKDLISISYRDISSGDYDIKKKSFINLHYLKILKDYFFLEIYYYNVKKEKNKEKLLNYLESILLANGINPK